MPASRRPSERGPGPVRTGAGPVSGQYAGGQAAGSSRTFAAFFRKRSGLAAMGNASSASGASGSTMSTLTHHDSDRSIGSSSATPTEESAPTIVRHAGTGSANGHCQKKSFRSLFRSVSANADSERTRQILKGDPRPADVAPPSPYLPHRSHSHSEKDRRRPGRRRILKSASELLSNDMIYCGLPVEDPSARADRNRRIDGEKYVADEDDDSEGGEVFLGVEDARYYNVSATVPGRGTGEDGPRRHSIGTFLEKDQRTGCNAAATGLTSFSVNPTRIRVQTTGFIREPDTMAPPIPTVDQVDAADRRTRAVAARNNRRCRRHKSASGKGESISLFSVSFFGIFLLRLLESEKRFGIDRTFAMPVLQHIFLSRKRFFLIFNNVQWSN